MKVKKICPVCGRKFWVYPYRENIAKYCSYKCAFNDRKKRVDKICIICHKKFQVHLSQKTQKFCSRKCMGVYFTKRIPKKCQICGKIFYPQKSRWEQSKYCSWACQALGTKGQEKKKSGKYKICPICGKEFYCRPKEFKRRITCSYNCKYQYKSLYNWQKDKHVFNYYKGRFFVELKGKGTAKSLPKFKLTPTDIKAIKAKVLIHKIRRSLNGQKET